MFTSHQLKLHFLLPTFIDAEQRRGNIKASKKTQLQESGLALPAILITLSFSLFQFSCSITKLIQFLSKFSMSSNISIDSVDSDVFYVEQISHEPSSQRTNALNILTSTEISQTHTARMPSISAIASPEPQIFTNNDNSNEPTMPYGFGRQLPIVPPSSNDLNLPPNPFNILATMAVINQTEDANDDNYRPQKPETSELSPMLTPPMNVSTFDTWETSHTTTDDNTFYSDDEIRRRYFLPSTPTPPPPPPPPRKLKRILSVEMSFLKRRGVSQHVCEACGQMIPSAKDIPSPSTKN